MLNVGHFFNVPGTIQSCLTLRGEIMNTVVDARAY